MDLSIVIVSWNVKDLLKQNLKEIFKSKGDFSFEVFVVDNASQDGSAEMVKAEFPEVKLIANKENLGFAKANNQAIRLSNGRYILLLNPDMRVFPNTLKNMIDWMDKNPEIGVGGCHLVDSNDNTILQIRNFPSLFDQMAIILKLPHIFPRILNKYLMVDFDYSKDSIVPSIRGSFFMIRREVIDKIGMLDERFFIWFEEVDFCKRVYENGWKVGYNSNVKCLDFVGKSFAQVMNFKKQKMFTQSMLKYFKKWHPKWQYFILLSLRPIGLGITFLFDQFLKIKKRSI